MKRLVIIGATSAIAQATARLLAQQDARFFLVARNKERLALVATDLAVRSGHEAGTFVMDCNDWTLHQAMLDAALEHLGGLDGLILAHGDLPDQTLCQNDMPALRQALETNLLSACALLQLVANHMASQGHGMIVGISSVAGDRGRQSNYIYGAAKAGLTVFLSGMRNALHAKGVKVVTVKPGFVDSPMTAGFAKNALWAQPEQVGRAIAKAMAAGGGGVVYTPWFWRWIMLTVRAIPEPLFMRLRL
jgi:short-subunit dehydrogenase